MRERHLTITVGNNGDCTTEGEAVKEAIEANNRTGMPVLVENIIGDPLVWMEDGIITYYN